MTIKQKQCLLLYLGYYGGAVDGIWGKKSQQATKDLQAAMGAEATGVFDEATEALAIQAVANSGKPPVAAEKPAEAESFWDGIKYFKRDEFRCKCGGKYCNGFPVEPDEKLVKLADRVREHFGAAATVSSGVRCEKHNAFVGGVANSRHTKGTAMDFSIRGLPSSIVLPYVQAQKEVRYAYAIDGSFVHMDIK